MAIKSDFSRFVSNPVKFIKDERGPAAQVPGTVPSLFDANRVPGNPGATGLNNMIDAVESIGAVRTVWKEWASLAGGPDRTSVVRWPLAVLVGLPIAGSLTAVLGTIATVDGVQAAGNFAVAAMKGDMRRS